MARVLHSDLILQASTRRSGVRKQGVKNEGQRAVLRRMAGRKVTESAGEKSMSGEAMMQIGGRIDQGKESGSMGHISGNLRRRRSKARLVKQEA